MMMNGSIRDIHESEGRQAELELYLHIPFCVKKCAYCDFLSAPADESVQAGYVEALKGEIRRQKALGADRRVTSVFIGGGTPYRYTCRNHHRMQSGHTDKG